VQEFKVAMCVGRKLIFGTGSADVEVSIRRTIQWFLHNMQREAAAISTWLMAEPRYKNEVAAAQKLKGKVSFLHYLMTRIELDVLISIASYLQGRKLTIRCLIYDGLLVQAPPKQEDQRAWHADLLRGAEAHVLAETSCSISLAIKPMQSCYVETLKNVPDFLFDDDYAAGNFVSLYGKYNFVYTKGSTHIFNKSTGLWGDSERTMGAAVHALKEKLVFKVGKTKLNYGGYATQISKMLSMVPNYIDVDDNFYTDQLDSSRGKLLFADGIYDFDTDSFTPSFDHQVVFAGRIDRNFDRHGTADAKQHVTKVMWADPYTSKQIKDGVPLCECIALARALYGDYRARKAYILVGNTGTGKGLKTTALEKSCGSFVSTFDINNFVHNPNSGADQAKQLSWLKQIVDKRIALSSEARTNTVLDGMLLKMVVSGGDTITLRTNHKDESQHINRSTLFMMCNDVPKIQPCDDAVQDRIGGVFDMQVEFKEKPNFFRPDHEKPRDPSLKDMMNKPEYQAAFLSTLLDAYQQYKQTAHTIPASVSAAIDEWVTNDCGLESLLAEVCESQLDPRTMQPLHDSYVPFDYLYQVLVVEGVGPQRNKVCMTKTKLGRQLALLGYQSDTRRVQGKNVRVRLGLTVKQGQINTCALEEYGGADF
jgi:hypothetical protein